MLKYRVNSIPDLTLSKYQVFADSGVDGMIEAQIQFIKQLHRVSLLGKASIHFLFDYDPSRLEGQKLNIDLIFNGLTDNDPFNDRLRKVINSSGISKYFNLQEVLPTGMTRVPSLSNVSLDVAINRLKKAQLRCLITGKEYSDDTPVNRILKQDILANSIVEKNSIVNLIVSGGQIQENNSDTIKEFSYMPEQQAIAWFQKQNMHIQTTYDANEYITKGLVISQTVDENNITLVISSGQVTFPMPKVAGEKLDDAKKILSDSEIVFDIEYKYVENTERGCIISQSIPANKEITKNSHVTLVVNDYCENMAVMYKKERLLQTSLNNEERYFYVVPNWEMNEEARLYSLLKMMQSFDEKCCYRVDLYTEEGLEEVIHKSFERPLTYLRNISNRNTGISELSKIETEKRDPNADETLHQYDNWLKAVDANPVYRCRISAYSNDAHICQLLLDSTVSESVQSGNASIKCSDKKGYYNPLDKLEIVESYCMEETPNSLKYWSTTFTSEEIAAFVRFPILYDGESIELPKETAALHEKDGIVLGYDENNYEVKIPEKLLPKHMFVCGVPGSGKTNTMLLLANSLWNNTVIDEHGNEKKSHIPFLVLEPAKREYRELALFDIPELIIFSPSACTNFPMKINPFEFPIGLTLSEHITNLCQVFEGAFPMSPPAPFILDQAIQKIYEDHGWNAKDINTGSKEYPTITELYNKFEIELSNTNYSGEVRGNIRSVLEMRIGSLKRRERKEIFDVSKSTLSPEEWLLHPVVIELESLGEGPANFVTLLLCTLIRETLKVNPTADKDKALRHVIFIEEAHNLISSETQVDDPQNSNPKIAATAFIVKMLAEVRALREGIIIADQLPTAMAPEVIKNTNIKLVHRLTSSDDRGLVGSTMSASQLQMENIATYTSGQALISYEKLLRPYEMQVKLVPEHGEETPDDRLLWKIMKNKPGYKQLLQREENNVLYELENEVAKLFEEESALIDCISKANIGAMTYAETSKWLETNNTHIGKLKFKATTSKYKCKELQSVDIERKEFLIKISETIGRRSEETLQAIYISLVKNKY